MSTFDPLFFSADQAYQAFRQMFEDAKIPSEPVAEVTDGSVPEYFDLIQAWWQALDGVLVGDVSDDKLLQAQESATIFTGALRDDGYLALADELEMHCTELLK